MINYRKGSGLYKVLFTRLSKEHVTEPRLELVTQENKAEVLNAVS
jgi:hypothetical protein